MVSVTLNPLLMALNYKHLFLFFIKNLPQLYATLWLFAKALSCF